MLSYLFFPASEFTGTTLTSGEAESVFHIGSFSSGTSPNPKPPQWTLTMSDDVWFLHNNIIIALTITFLYSTAVTIYICDSENTGQMYAYKCMQRAYISHWCCLSLEILTNIFKSKKILLCCSIPTLSYFLLVVSCCLLLNVSSNCFVLWSQKSVLRYSSISVCTKQFL